MAVNKAARQLIKPGGGVLDGLLNMVETAFRPFDPCFSCATHSRPGQMPLTVEIPDREGVVLNVVAR